MFRWCSYCQTLLGESAPFEDYRISHGVCDTCAERLNAGEVFPPKGLELFNALFASAKAGNFDACRAHVDESLARGWRPSDVAVGLLQPALYEIGRLWEEGKATVEEEHRFTSWCDRALTLLEERAPNSPGPVRVLICLVGGNEHALGARIAALYLRDRGIPARAVVPAKSDQEIMELCRVERPELLGLSSALCTGIARVRAISALVAGLPRPPRVVLGGLAARLPEAEGLDRAFTPAEIQDYLG